MTEFTTWRSLVDGEIISAVPDSAIAQYIASDFDPETGVWADNLGNFDLSASGNPQLIEDEADGNDVVRLDGVDDLFDSDNTNINISQPFTVISAIDPEITDGENTIWSHNSSDIFRFRVRDGGEDWRLRTFNTQFSGGEATRPAITTTVVNGSDSLIRVNGSDVASGEVDNLDLANIRLGASSEDDDRNYTGDMAEQVFYDNDLNADIIQQEEERLSQKYGYTLS